MYLTYPEYLSYGGTLEESAFVSYEFGAERLIDWYTFNRLKQDTTFPDEVKHLLIVLIKFADLRTRALAIDKSGTGTGEIVSQSNDGVSVSYNAMSASDIYENSKKECVSVINEYLYGVTNQAGLLLTYRGLYPGE